MAVKSSTPPRDVKVMPWKRESDIKLAVELLVLAEVVVVVVAVTIEIELVSLAVVAIDCISCYSRCCCSCGISCSSRCSCFSNRRSCC